MNCFGSVDLFIDSCSFKHQFQPVFSLFSQVTHDGWTIWCLLCRAVIFFPFSVDRKGEVSFSV